MIPQPKLQPRPDKNLYELIEDYTYACTVDDVKISITVPVGFEYDGASIPAIGWVATYTPFHPDVMCAALVHDFLYDGNTLGVDRYTADSILYQLLVENGVREQVAEIMYQAVRIGGGSHWRTANV
jgi:hypothetical protein